MAGMGGNQPPNKPDDEQKKASGVEVQNQILGALQPRRGAKTAEWLARVAAYGAQNKPAEPQQNPAPSPVLPDPGQVAGQAGPIAGQAVEPGLNFSSEFRNPMDYGYPSQAPPQPQPLAQPQPPPDFWSVPGGKISVANSFDLVIQSVDCQLKTLADAGSRAFASQDTVMVERVLRRTAKLQTIRTEMLATLTRWKNALAEE